MAKSEKMNLSAKLGLDDVLHLLPSIYDHIIKNI